MTLLNVAIINVACASQIIIDLTSNVPQRCLQGEKLDFVASVRWDGTRQPVEIGWQDITLEEFALRYQQGKLDGIVVPLEAELGQSTLTTDLLALGVNIDDVYYPKRLVRQLETSILDSLDATDFLRPYCQASYLPYLEVHLADHCNLNCRACEHYSGLVKTPKFTSFQGFSRDLQRVHDFIEEIGTVRLLGGEPLLNPEINKYMILVREQYPQAHIVIVTNALKLMSMPDNFFRTVREQNVKIGISYYPPLKGQMENIRKFLDEQKVLYGISSLVNQFTIKQVLHPHDHPREQFLHCFQAHCVNLYEGKLAACFLPFTTRYFNAAFGTELPEDGALDIYDSKLTLERIKLHLLQPFSRCAYCDKPVPIMWSRIHKPSILSDWVLDEKDGQSQRGDA